MVYVVETKFCIGIYLSQVGVKKNNYLKKACVTSIEDYSEALEIVFKKAEGKISYDDFIPNQLYQIKSKKIYSVIYDWNNVGFTLTESLGQFMRDNNVSIRYSKCHNNLEYQEAIAMVTSLGAITGAGKVFQTRSPLPNLWYWREK